MSTEPSLLYQIALTCIKHVGNATAKHLLTLVDDVSELFTSSKDKLRSIPGIPPTLINEIADKNVLKRADKEMDFVLKNNITPFFINSKNYPYRLLECNDAPILFYYKGTANLNAPKIISIVGTRNMTPYGNSATNAIIDGLKHLSDELLIISGLAYGIDISAHRAALRNNIPTIAVLAHGLDRIYPSIHKNTAYAMLRKGGLISEFMTETKPDRQNFVKRNRIIAGLSDAVLVVESGQKGGSIITAEIANSYFREVFAIPGRNDDEYSRGCNHLIRLNKAGLIENASDLLEAMNWQSPKKEKNVEIQLPLAMNEEEEIIIQILAKEKESQINDLSVHSNIPIHKLSSLLFNLEFRGIIRCCPGGIYKLV